jgi:predicted dehydrogenase
MKFLIAGLGSIGRRHLNNLIALGERNIILYRTHTGTLPDEDLAEFPIETNFEAALNREPDAVIISNPTSLHLDVAIPAAQAGCHIFLEKPISHSMNRVDEFISALKDGGGKVLVGYQFRFHPGLRMVKELLDDGAIGRPTSVRAHWAEYLPGWHPWEDYRLGYSARNDLGGGVILTLSHPLDYMLWLIGEVQEVWAFAGTLGELGLEVEDTAEISMRFSQGVIGSIHLDYLQQPPNHFLEIIGTDGTIQWDYARGGVRVYRGKQMNWKNYSISNDFQRNDMFLSEMRHFIDLIHGKEESMCTLSDGVRALELALAAKRAADKKEMVRMR